MDEHISTFCAFTSATPEVAQRFLTLTDGEVEQAISLYFNNPDLGAADTSNAQSDSRPARVATGLDADDAIDIDDDGDDLQEIGHRTIANTEDDEAMARRLQEEMYGGSRGAGAGADMDEVRAPMARTTETLVGPGSDWRDDPNSMNAAIAEQLMRREAAMRRPRAAPGIFNQRNTESIWNEEHSDDAAASQRARLSRATGGASDQSSKSNHLAELFRPPFDLISRLSFAQARDEGKADEKWILVNVQDPSIFDCQVLNRDVWKDQRIRDIVREHFIFLQYNKEDHHAQEYINYYMSALRHSDDAFPFIGIIDPRTGEQVKTWSGSPAPKAADFIMDLHEFLDRYSLSMEKKNPVQTKRKESRKDVAEMSEEEMLQMAMQNSLSNGASSGPRDEDPDALTRSINGLSKGKGKQPVGSDEPQIIEDDDLEADNANDSPFAQISSSKPHEEPPASIDPKTTTRIQFRHSGGRVVRKFLLTDPVRRIYEWLKASPLEGADGKKFEIIAMGKNLIDSLDLTIDEAGLKNASVMVELVED